MNKHFYKISIFLLIFLITGFLNASSLYASGLAENLKGKILLQVEENGEAWYVYPNNLQRYYLGRPADAFNVMSNLGLGISEKDFNNLNGYGKNSLSGKIILRVESHGEAYYINTYDLKLHYLGRPADAFGLMRSLGLGITNANLSQIKTASTSMLPANQTTTIETPIVQIPKENQQTSPIDSNIKSFTEIINYTPRTNTQPINNLNLAFCVINWTADLDLPTNNYLENYFSIVNDNLYEISLGHSRINQITIARPQINSPLSLKSQFPDEEQLALSLCDSLIDFSEVDVFLVYPSAVAGRGGASPSSMPPLQTAEKAIESRVLLGHFDETNGLINHLTNDKYGTSLVIHELTHTSAFNYTYHDSALNCETQSFKQSGCNMIEYGHPFSSMSNSYGHFSAWYKYLIKSWVKKTDVYKNGFYTLAALELPTTLPQLIRLPETSEPLCLEYRKPVSLDEEFSISNMSAQGNPGGIPEEGCLFINICDENKNYLLDTHPNTQTNDAFEFFDACLQSGEVFYNGELNVELSFDINNDNTSRVSIYFR